MESSDSYSPPVKPDELMKRRRYVLIGMLMRAWSHNFALRRRVAELEHDMKELRKIRSALLRARIGFSTAAEATRQLEEAFARGALKDKD